jgi:predicted dehydrogenase
VRDRVRVGIIGAGSWANQTHLPALRAMQDVEVAFVQRRDGERARRLADRWGVANALTDWREGLALGVDAVVVASPPNAHEEQVTAALATGAHVLCEKPFAIHADAAWRMVRAARTAGRTLLIAFGWNYMPLIQSARRLMDDRRIGDLEFLTLDLRVGIRDLLSSGAAYTGTGDVPPRAETFIDPAVSGGGQAPVSMSHVFGLALYLSRLEATRISAQMWDGPAGVDVHDATIVTFENGAVGALTAASTHRLPAGPEWNVGIFGAGGHLAIDTANATVAFSDPEGRRHHPPGAGNAGGYEPGGPIRELIAVARGAKLGDESPAELGARTVELVEAAYRSRLSGRAEEVASAARDR